MGTNKVTLTPHDRRVLHFVLGEQKKVCELKERRRRMRDWKHCPLSVHGKQDGALEIVQER